MQLEHLLMAAMPGVAVEVEEETLDVKLPDGSVSRFLLVDGGGAQIAPRVRGDRLPLLILERPTRAAIERLRASGASFATADGSVVSLRAPGVYVEVTGRARLGEMDRLRNPFSARALGVALQFLLEPDRTWTVTELARAATVSSSFTSRVVAGLREEGLVVEREGELSADPTLLFVATAREWPRRRAFFAGRSPTVAETILGGGPAYQHHGLAVGGRPRAYSANRDQLRMLTVATVSSPTAARLADWEAILLPLPLPNGFAPPAVLALELAADPRGREALRESGLVAWEILG